MATLNRTFSVKNGIDVANTVIIDSNRNLSNIATANATTVNATTFITVAGLNIADQANTANNTANGAYFTANVANTTANLAYALANTSYLPAVTRLSVTNSGASDYLFDQYSGGDPTLYVRAGETIAFSLAVTGHPFMIRVSSGGSNYSTGLTHVATDGTVSTDSSAQGKVTGTLYWKVPYTLQGNTYVYQCSAHAGMVGNIVIEPPMVVAYAQANNAYSAANGAANTVRVSANSGSTLSSKQLNFANSASIQVTVSDSGDGNANVVFNTTGAAVADAYAKANAAANLVAVYANGSLTMANANVNFNNTATVNVSVAANATNNFANVGFSVNVASSDWASGANSSAQTTFGTVNTSLGTINTNYQAAYAQANAAANLVAVYANGILTMANANVNFNNTATVNVSVTANATNKFANIEFSANGTQLGIPAINTALDSMNTATNLKYNTAGGTITGNVVITGNLEVLGDYTTLNVATLSVEDNEIILNSTTAGAPSLDGVITINRGSSTNAVLKWDETTDQWKWMDGDNVFYAFDSALDAYARANTANNTANGAYFTANLAYNDANTRVLKSGDAMTGNLFITSTGYGLAVANANVSSLLTVGSLNVSTNTVTTSSSGQVVLDVFATTSLASAKYFVQANSSTSYHTTEVVLVQDATNVYLTEYGSIQTGASLGTFSADISSGDVRLLFNATNNINTIRAVRYGIKP